MDQSPCDFCSADVDTLQEVYRGNKIKVLYPRRPLVEHHFLIMPIEHKEHIDELSSMESEELFAVVKKVASILTSSHNLSGYNLLVNTGEKAGQTVNHAHVHFWGRYDGEPISPQDVLNDPQKYALTKIESIELESIVHKIKQLFE